MTHGPVRDEAARGFERSFGCVPAGLVRAPGRVNLIGEHVDYCGLRVMPLAIERSVWLAYGPGAGSRVRVSATDPAFEPGEFEAAGIIPPAPTGDWTNYVRAAVEDAERDGLGVGFDAVVATDLPVAAGLSSSSALVVAVALAARAVRGITGANRLELAGRLAAAERYVGTAGGGMDQAASLLGRAGHALLIDFDPLAVTPVPFPDGWRLVVAHSGEVAEKSGPEQDVYNRRTRESASALRTVASELGVAERAPRGREAGGFRRLLEAYGVEELLEAGERCLRGPEARRFRHVVSEAGRVEETVGLLGRRDLAGTGARLDASHRSLRDDYEVSTPRLDELTDAMRRAGAAGARLTGAGMGGCAIGLCDDRSVDDVLAAAREFVSRVGGPPIAFVARPGDGAELIVPKPDGSGGP